MGARAAASCSCVLSSRGGRSDELIEVLESVGVLVRFSLGSGTRLLTRLVAYAVGFEVGVNTVKALVLQRSAK